MVNQAELNYFFNESTLIKCIRKIHNLSQQDFCQLMGYSQSALSKIENGFISPDLKFVVDLSQRLGIDLNIFRYGHIPKISTQSKQNVEKNFISKKYLENGVLSAKSTFTLIELIKNNYEENIYKKMDIAEDLFCLSFLKYNPEFFQKLSSIVEKDKMIALMQGFSVRGLSLFSEEAFKNHLTDNRLVKLGKVFKDQDFLKFDLKLTKKASVSQLSRDEVFWLSLVYFDLLVTFNIPMKLKTFMRPQNSDCEITVYASA